MPAPVASGWSDRRAGLAPAGKAPPCHGARGKLPFPICPTSGLLVWGGGAPSDAPREELTKRLVSAKAAIQAGLSFAGLGTEETQLRAAAELADRRLNDSERKAVADAIFAIHQTRSAWQASFDSLCTTSDGYVRVDLTIPTTCTAELTSAWQLLNSVSDINGDSPDAAFAPTEPHGIAPSQSGPAPC